MDEKKPFRTKPLDTLIGHKRKREEINDEYSQEIKFACDRLNGFCHAVTLQDMKKTMQRTKVPTTLYDTYQDCHQNCQRMPPELIGKFWNYMAKSSSSSMDRTGVLDSIAKFIEMNPFRNCQERKR